MSILVLSCSMHKLIIIKYQYNLKKKCKVYHTKLNLSRLFLDRFWERLWDGIFFALYFHLEFLCFSYYATFIQWSLIKTYFATQKFVKNKITVEICITAYCFFTGDPTGDYIMGLYKQYFRISQYARNQLFKVDAKNANSDGIPLQMLVSQQFNQSKFFINKCIRYKVFLINPYSIITISSFHFYEQALHRAAQTFHTRFIYWIEFLTVYIILLKFDILSNPFRKKTR